MGSHQLITVPDCNWIIITSNNLKGVVKVITARDRTKWWTRAPSSPCYPILAGPKDTSARSLACSKLF